MKTLHDIIREGGPIKTVRVSSTNFSYCGAALYELRLNKDGDVVNVCVRGAGSARRSRRNVERDADETGRIRCQTIGRLSEEECRRIAEELRCRIAASWRFTASGTTTRSNGCAGIRKRSNYDHDHN